MTEIRVNPAGSDCALCAKLESECLDTAWSEKQISDRGELCTYLAAFDGKKAVGICSYYTVSDEKQIMNLAVAKDYRRKGIASMLMNLVCTGDLPVSLEVDSCNEGAIAFYETYGFCRAGKRKGLHGSDAYIMVFSNKEGND